MSQATVRRDVAAGPARMYRAAPVAVLTVVAGASAYVATHNPFEQQVTPPCLLFHFLGVYCPGCGGTRAAYSLMHGDVAGALQMNAFVTLLIIPPAILALGWWLARSAGLRVPRVTIPSWLVWGYLWTFLAFSIARNFPFFAPYLAP